VFDQRGTGFSDPSLNCIELETDEYDDEDSALAACRDRLIDEGIDLSAYNSANSAADVSELINLLADEMDYDSFNLLGVSYGTRLALTILRDDDNLIRSAILDSVYPPNIQAYESEPLDSYGALAHLFASCAADFDCNAAYPDLETTLIETIDSLNANPALFTTEDFETGDLIDAEMTGDLVVDLLVNALYDSELIPLLPQFIDEASAGNFDLVAEIDSEGSFRRQSDDEDDFDDFEDDLGDISDSEGLFHSVECVEEMPFNSLANAETAAASIPVAIREALLGEIESIHIACDIWSVEAAAALENEPVFSDVPTLLLVGVFDPVTPLSWAELAAETLSDHYLYVFPDQGHSVLTANECAMQITLDFLIEPTLEPDSSCLAMETAPEFVIE
jgi:pimeloyl-ACP methyl ester carboxylesterase